MHHHSFGTFRSHCSRIRAVIPGTKCQVYHACSGGEPTNVNQCGDWQWYDPKSDHCEAQIQGVPIDCPPDPACPTPSQSNPTTGSPEFQGETTGKILLNSLTFFVLVNRTNWAKMACNPAVAIQIENPSFSPPTQENINILRCFTPCANGFTGNEAVPSTGCKVYHECWMGTVRSRNECGSPLIFDEARNYCNFPSEVSCPLGSEHVGCVESNSPITTILEVNPPPSPDPSISIPIPTFYPSSALPQPILDVRTIGSQSAITYIESKRYLIEKYILISYDDGASGLPYPSIRYTYEGFIRSLQIMGVDGFGADFMFNLWDGQYYGLVNLAAFLANCMVESIEADTCDELNWQESFGKHPLSNACGQESRSYQDETCDMNNDTFSCDVIPSMKIMAVTTASSEDLAPPPLQCKPVSGQGNHSGYWENGGLIANVPLENDLGRTDTQGCCFWGRGALLTRGVCNIGKINYYLGKGGADVGRYTLYPSLDFCGYPEATCASAYSEDLRWTVAFFEWAERIQRYHVPNSWQYEEMLIQFVDNGMADDSFIDSVSRILSRGCHESGCSEVRMLDKRRSNFYLIINDIFDINSLLNPSDPTNVPVSPISLTLSIPVPQYPMVTDVSPRPSPENQLIDLEGNDALLAVHNKMVIISCILLYGAYYLMLL